MSFRSTESPMDFTFTSRDAVKPVWARGGDPSTPRKRPHEEPQMPVPSPFGSRPPPPSFGANADVPFLFKTPSTPQPQNSYPWAPPPGFSPTKAFPQPEINDVDMADASPEQPRRPGVHFAEPAKDKEDKGGEEKEGRVVALGGLRRVFKKRQKELARTRRRRGRGEEDEDEDETEDEDEEIRPITQNTSNHYTLNMPGITGPSGDLPYMLLGYLQFFFNLSLILLFLYLLVQFILTVQRDVEHRVAEYSRDVVQDIAHCALQFRENRCGDAPVPAIAAQCGRWKTCMERDPTKVGRARVGAELIAEVVNGFVEPISWKTLGFTLTSLAFLTVFINTLLSLYRAKHAPVPIAPVHPLQQHPSFPGLPAHSGYAQTHFPIAPPTPYPQAEFSWRKGEPGGGEETPTRARRRRLE